jgi:hypothetical protein
MRDESPHASRKLPARRLTLLLLGMVIGILVLSALSTGLLAPNGHAATSLAAPNQSGASRPLDLARTNLAGPPPVERTYRGVSEVYQLASVGKYALLVLNYPSGLSSLVLVNAATNSSKVVERTNPGGAGTYPESLVGAGGSFFMEWENGTTYQMSWQEISTNGTVRSVTLPLAPSAGWTFAFGNASALFVSAGPNLLEVDPTTLAIAANYSTEIGSSVTGITSVLPVDGRLYIAGNVFDQRTNLFRAYFGFINLTSDHLTTVAVIGPRTNATYTYFFDVMVEEGSDVYVGGVAYLLNTTVYQSTVGLLYRYDTTTSRFANLSAILPHSDWGVFGLEPWAHTVAVSLNWFSINITDDRTRQVGGIYTLSHTSSLHLVNVTATLANGYVPNTGYVTAGSSGWFFTGGGNSISGKAEFVAIRP